MCHRMKESGFRVFITSRSHPDDIRDSLSDEPQIQVTAQNKDLKRYIDQHVDANHANPRARKLIRGNRYKDQIINGLVDAADGM